MIFAEGGAPIAVCSDGNCYYGSGWGGGHEHEAGGATVSRLSPDGTISSLPSSLKDALSKGRGGVTGLAAGTERLVVYCLINRCFESRRGWCRYIHCRRA